ncbi:hypothetical protein [Novosphingobium sp.]|uniref:hypothetical protein n=1 Tax=Novosphingobium sp. TaxID=1874826 RepID=UPI001EC1D4D0|nr:hypothetical protein [Novosphingobium sp.]MBK9011241.1 hypothetical protein [Novosphingobium sp.]
METRQQGQCHRRFKPDHYPARELPALLDYRPVPAATVEQQAADVAGAVKTLVDRADRTGDRSAADRGRGGRAARIWWRWRPTSVI